MQCRVRRVQFELGQRVLAIGGVRGRLPLLEQLLRTLRYRPGQDGLVFLGDLMGNGSMNLETLHYAMQLARTPCVYFIAGDEDLLPPAITDEAVQAVWRERLAAQSESLFWQLCARVGLRREAALEQPGAAMAALRPKFQRELDFLSEMPHIIEDRQYLFAHAGLRPGPMDQQRLETVLFAGAFHEGVLQKGGVFPKLLAVGHWPAGWYGRTTLCHAPRSSPYCRLVSVDGGLGAATGGQLNGAILRRGVCEGFAMADGLPQIRAVRGQVEHRGAVCLPGPEYAVRCLRPGPGGRLCLHPSTGGQTVVPEGWLCQTAEGGWRLRGDTPSWFPPITPGQTVGLAALAGELALIKTGSHLGWARWESFEPPQG